MELDKNIEPEKEKENDPTKEKNWIDKTEDFLDETADKIYESKTYEYVGKSLENATISIFREAGKWWGKTRQPVEKSSDKKDTE